VFWVGSATVFNLLVWVVAGKVMAVMLGPAGVGMYGLLRQLAQNLNVASTFNGSTTLVQGLASRPENQRPAYSRNVAIIFLGLGLTVGIMLTLGASWLGPHLLGKQMPPGLLRWMVLPLVGMSLSAFFLGMLNGYRHLKALVVCQALGPLAALALIYPAALWIRGGGYWAYGLILGVPYALIGLAAALVSFRQGWFTRSAETEVKGSFGRDSRHFFGLSTALLIGGAATTGLQLFLNTLVVRKLGLAESGQFWVAWSLSMTYVTVLLSSFGAYYLPSLSGTRDSETKRTLILSFTRLVLLIMPVLVTLVIILKAQVVRLLFSQDLLPSLKVFRWMLLGDFLKVLSWVWAFPMLAYAEGKTFVILETTTSLVWGFLAWIAFSHFPSIEILGQLFCVIYLLYSATTLTYLWHKHDIRMPANYWCSLIRGLMVIGFASALFWNHHDLSLLRVLLALIPAILNLGVSLTRSERNQLRARIFGA
jgi:PST family polysaccharide transporter